jgi:hypothetical protein
MKAPVHRAPLTLLLLAAAWAFFTYISKVIA